MLEIAEPVRKSLTKELINSLMLKKKQLESIEKNIYKNTRVTVAKNRVGENKKKMVFTEKSMNFSISKETTFTKEMRIPKHILVEECGLSEDVGRSFEAIIKKESGGQKVGGMSFDWYPKRLAKGVAKKSCRRKNERPRLIEMPAHIDYRENSIRRSATPVLKQKHNAYHRTFLPNFQRLNEWNFTPL